MLRKFHKLAKWVIAVDCVSNLAWLAFEISAGAGVLALLVAQRKYEQVPHLLVEPVLYLLVLALGVWVFYDARKAARTIRKERQRRRVERRKTKDLTEEPPR